MIKIENVSYTYQSKYQTVQAVKNATYSFEPGVMYAITGRSGSGKSTLLSLLAGLDVPTSGSIALDGETTAQMDRDAYRLNHISVIYQNFNLFAHLTALENVELALQICRNPLDAKEVLKEVGLESRMKNFPAQLSGGEQQRVAIARAIAAKPPVILADEPTGNLDEDTASEIIELIKKTAHELGKCVIVVTHSKQLAEEADVVLEISRGKLSEREIPKEDTTDSQFEENLLHYYSH